jgi:hypothetical protein
MAKGMEPSRPAEKEYSLAEIHLAMRRLQRRASDVEAFDPTKVRSQQDPNIRALEAAIKETLAEIFGANSRTYRSYAAAAALDSAGINMNGTPLHEVIEGLVRGKERSLVLLRGAIRLLEEKIEDNFPDAINAAQAADGASRDDGRLELSRKSDSWYRYFRPWWCRSRSWFTSVRAPRWHCGSGCTGISRRGRRIDSG